MNVVIYKQIIVSSLEEGRQLFCHILLQYKVILLYYTVISCIGTAV